MKIEVHFRDQIIGTGTSRGNEVFWEGEGSNRIKMIAAHYERQGFKGDVLLQKMLERLQGMWWAQEI
jgi:hypothetical protein